jgi:hypothetical protein
MDETSGIEDDVCETIDVQAEQRSHDLVEQVNIFANIVNEVATENRCLKEILRARESGTAQAEHNSEAESSISNVEEIEASRIQVAEHRTRSGACSRSSTLRMPQ